MAVWLLSRSLKKAFCRLCRRCDLASDLTNDIKIAATRRTIVAVTHRDVFSDLFVAAEENRRQRVLQTTSLCVPGPGMQGIEQHIHDLDGIGGIQML